MKKSLVSILGTFIMLFAAIIPILGKSGLQSLLLFVLAFIPLFFVGMWMRTHGDTDFIHDMKSLVSSKLKKPSNKH